MNNSIDFTAAFNEAEATTSFDQLITVLSMATKAVKAERDRLTRDDTAEDKFHAAVKKVSALSTKLAADPTLIDDFWESGRAVQVGEASTPHLSKAQTTSASLVTAS